MKTKLAVNGVRDGVDKRIGVWSDSASGALKESDTVACLVGMVIFGLGFSSFALGLVDGPGSSEVSDSIFIPRREERGGWESESESESILQMGRWASRTNSSLSFSFCNCSISFFRRDFSSSNSSVSFCSVSVSSRRRFRHLAAASLLRSLLTLRLSISSDDKCSSFLRLVGPVEVAAALMTPGRYRCGWVAACARGRTPEKPG